MKYHFCFSFKKNQTPCHF